MYSVKSSQRFVRTFLYQFVTFLTLVFCFMPGVKRVPLHPRLRGRSVLLYAHDRKLLGLPSSKYAFPSIYLPHVDYEILL